MATEFLSRQHRRIEQLLRTLRSDGHRRNRLLLELTGELTTHLAVESHLVFPAAASALGRPLSSERALHRKLQTALISLTPGVTGDEFTIRLDSLTRLFQQHVESDRVLFLALVSAVDGVALEDLRDDVEAFAAALMAKCRPYVRTHWSGYAA